MSKELGKELKKIRESKGFSLRDIEKKSEHTISSSYLSQVETGKIQQPSPRFLHRISKTYDVDYEKLMETSGYLERKKKPEIAASFKIEDLTENEIDQVKHYIEFLRSRRENH